MHSWKASNEIVFVQGGISYKASGLERMGAFINLCNQNATLKTLHII